MKPCAIIHAIGVLLFVVACTSSGDGTGGGGGSTGTGATGGGGDGGAGGGTVLAPYNTVSWLHDIVEVDSPTLKAGIQGKLLRGNDGTLYYGYLKYAGASDATCDIAVFAGGEAPGVNYALKVAVKPASTTTWTVETVPLGTVPGANHEYLNSLFGLDGVVEDNGDGAPVFTLCGGGAGLASCGSSDLVLARRTGANTYQFVPGLPTDSDACCVYPGECPDENCEAGTDVGAWAAIAESPTGELAVAYTDYHNFWDNDGQRWQGFEMWHETDGVFGIEPWSGRGHYDVAAYAGDILLVAYTGYFSAGLWVARRISSAASVTSWDIIELRNNVEVGERVSMAVASDGTTVGIAYHEAVDSYGSAIHDLRYCESADSGATWGTCANIGNQLWQVGFYPSLAFDNEDRPVIAYRFCGVDSCENAYDGAGLSWREHSGVWKTKTIHDEASSKSGLYCQLVLDPATNEPTVVFQNLTTGAAMVAYGAFP